MASFRGVPFYVVSNSGENGREIAQHNYPLRDETWIEDLGRSQKRYAIHGFLIGETYIAQRNLIISAVEQAGPGILIHPTFGILQVSITRFNWSEPENVRLRINLDFEFIEYSNPVAGLISQAIGPLVNELSDALSNSAIGDFINDTENAFDLGLGPSATSVASAWGRQAFLQGTGGAPIAALSELSNANITNSLGNLATNQKSLSDALLELNPNFDLTGGLY